MKFNQDTFRIYSPKGLEGMVNIEKMSSGMVLTAEQDMETRVLRALTAYIFQQEIKSKIATPKGIIQFLHYYNPEREIISSRSSPREVFVPEITPYYRGPSPLEISEFAIDGRGNTRYHPKIKRGDLVFTVGDKEALIIHPSEADDLIVGLFNSAQNPNVGIRATVNDLSRELDVRYYIHWSKQVLG